MRAQAETVASAAGVLGEVTLRRRPGEDGEAAVLELIVNGVFLMDTEDTSSEERLAVEAARRVPTAGRVLVGGLGLGFTVAALLREPRATRIDVLEIEPSLVDWMRRGLVPATAHVMMNPRVRVVVDDVLEYVQRAGPASWVAVVLDVDNGPTFLAHDRNAPLYQAESIAAVNRVLHPGGVLAVWSTERSPALVDLLSAGLGPCEEIGVPVARGGRAFSYFLYVAVKPPPEPEPLAVSDIQGSGVQLFPVRRREAASGAGTARGERHPTVRDGAGGAGSAGEPAASSDRMPPRTAP